MGRWSWIAIARHFDLLGVSPTHAKDNRAILRLKRKQATSGVWHHDRNRNVMVNTTYKRRHRYGKWAQREREVIEREVLAFVSTETWERAHQTLQENLLFCDRGVKRLYLLRGLAECSMCACTYVGTAYPDDRPGRKVYYVCGGMNSGRGSAALQYRRCPSKAIRGDIEEEVWNDIEGFLRHPGEVLQQLAERLQDREGEAKRFQAHLGQLRQALQGKEVERERVVALYRRGRIEEKALDQQLDEIDREEKAIKEQVGDLEARILGTQAVEKQLRTAEDLLVELGRRLDEPLDWELKRQLVETLVEGIQVETVERDGKKQAVVTVSYRFTPPVTCTGTRAATSALWSIPAVALLSRSLATSPASPGPAWIGMTSRWRCLAFPMRTSSSWLPPRAARRSWSDLRRVDRLVSSLRQGCGQPATRSYSPRARAVVVHRVCWMIGAEA